MKLYDSFCEFKFIAINKMRILSEIYPKMYNKNKTNF